MRDPPVAFGLIGSVRPFGRCGGAPRTQCPGLRRIGRRVAGRATRLPLPPNLVTAMADRPLQDSEPATSGRTVLSQLCADHGASASEINVDDPPTTAAPMPAICPSGCIASAFRLSEQQPDAEKRRRADARHQRPERRLPPVWDAAKTRKRTDTAHTSLSAHAGQVAHAVAADQPGIAERRAPSAMASVEEIQRKPRPKRVPAPEVSAEPSDR